MKGVVLEIKNGYAAVLSEDGTVIKLKRKCNVGDTLQFSDKDVTNSGNIVRMRALKTASKVAAVLLVVSIGAGGYYSTATAASYVSVDAGDSEITLSLNHFGRVIKVEGSDEATIELAASLYDEGIRNDKLPEALKKTERIMQSRGIADSETDINVSIESINERTFEKLKAEAERNGFNTEKKGEAEDITVPQSKEEQNAADRPEMPERPEPPESPEISERPEMPEPPEKPEISERPEMPEVPEIPNKPEEAENPARPEEQEVTPPSLPSSGADAPPGPPSDMGQRPEGDMQPH